MSQDRFEGCLLGLALGDALGAPYEGGPLERLLWKFIGKTRDGKMRWTDDTQMSLDVAESLLAKGGLDPEDLAERFARNYRWSRGYGPSTAKILKKIALGVDWHQANRIGFPDGSFGNGGAMRSPVIGLWYSGRLHELAEAARLAARITHAHPLGMDGAVLVASATALALSGNRPYEVLQGAAANCESNLFSAKLKIATQWLQSGEEPANVEVVRQLGNGMEASQSCVTALYLAFRFMERPFLEMMEFINSCGGDTDTVGAMAGAIWGTANGSNSLPKDLLDRLEQRERITSLASDLYSIWVNAGS